VDNSTAEIIFNLQSNSNLTISKHKNLQQLQQPDPCKLFGI